VSQKTWYHLALAYAGNMAYIYVNGKLFTSDTRMIDSSKLKTTRFSCLFGPSHALLDEIKIYNKALSQSQVQTDMTTVGVTDFTDVC
jgi:hypothetical protein